jgi:outer membrane protein assembly factor BamB
MLLAAYLLLAGPAAPTTPAPVVRWHHAGSTVYGTGVPIAASATEVVTAELGPRLTWHRLDNGKVTRRVRLKGCDIVTRMQAAGDLLVFFCEHVPGEEETAVSVSVPVPRGILVAQSLRTGKRLWKLPVSAATGPFITTPQTVFWVDDVRLSAVTLTTGTVAWSKVLPQSQAYVLVAAGERVFVAADAGALYALMQGKEIWQKPLPAGHPSVVAGADLVVASVAVRGDPALDSDDQELVRAFNQSSGEPAWQSNTGAALCAPMAQSGTTLLLVNEARGSTPSALRALELGSGKLLWLAPVAVDCNGHDFTPQAAGDAVAIWSGVATEDDPTATSVYELRALALGSGKELWRHRPPPRDKLYLSAPLWRDQRVAYADGTQAWGLAVPATATAAEVRSPEP